MAIHVDNLAKATALHNELKLWVEGRTRCNPGVFRGATLRITDAAHGHQQQIAETVIQVPAAELIGFIDAQTARLQAALRELGVDL